MLPTINIAPVHTPLPTVGNVVDTGVNASIGNLSPTVVSPPVSSQEANLGQRQQATNLERALANSPSASSTAPTSPGGATAAASGTALSQPSAAFITQLLAQTTLKGSLKDITYDFFTRGATALYPTLISFGDVKFVPNEESAASVGDIAPAPAKTTSDTLAASDFTFPVRSIPDTDQTIVKPIDILA